MPRFAANLSLMFTELPFLDRFAAAARAGFRGVEFLFPYDWPPHEIKLRLDTHGLEQVLFNISPGDWAAGERGLAALTGREDEFEAETALALNYAEALHCRQIHAMAGLVTQGTDRDTYLRNLRRAARMAAPLGVTVLIEPINPIDIPGYFLVHTAAARDIIAEVGEPNLKLQLDLYHRQMAEGDPAAAIRHFAPLVAHYQCAGAPGRHEPDTGDLDYRPLFRAIDETGFTGWIGCEYRPAGDTEAGLAWRATLGVA